MAEQVASMVVRPILSALMDKVSSHLLDKYRVLDGMEQQHQLLKRKLPAIMDIINDAEHMASRRAGVNAWLQALKAVAYEANDIFADFHYEALRRQAEKSGHIRDLGVKSLKFLASHNRFMFRSRVSERLKSVVEQIEILSHEMVTFGFSYGQQAPGSMQYHQTDSILVDHAKIISCSRNEEKEKIVKILTGPASDVNPLVIAIVGMGGLGKTSLAQLVFNDPNVQKYFEKQNWVSVPEDFDIQDLAVQIFEGSTGLPMGNTLKQLQGDSSGLHVDNILKKLRSETRGQKYLIVLDNVQNRNLDKWEKLKACLANGAVGSAILVTTRSKEVAALMHTIEDHQISPLDKKFISEIIQAQALSLRQSTSLDQQHATKLSMADKFADRCAGSPLAAKSLGGMLCTKRTIAEWEHVLRETNICSMGDSIFPVLKLNFDDLPPDMKQCFIFCAMFPKGRPIIVEKLIQLWIANGFIQGSKDLDIIGNQIFEELTSRYFFQDVKQKPYQYYRTCTMHDLMYDVAASNMDKECYIVISSRGLYPSRVKPTIHDAPKLVDCPETARYIFLPFPATINSLGTISPKVRTILCDNAHKGPVQHMPKYVRALQLFTLNSTIPIRPQELYLLRYLDLSHSHITELPEDITILYDLQVLDLSYCIYLRRLPRLMKYMTSLRHLYTTSCFALEMMPQQLGKLTSLETLSCFVAGHGTDCSTVRELHHLKLRGQLQLLNLENVRVEDAKAANIRNKELGALTLSWVCGCENDSVVIQALQPNDGLLQTLIIESYHGAMFPTWMQSLQNLVEIFLMCCENLQYIITGSSFEFPNLKELRLDQLPMLERLWESNEMQVEKILFPKLEKLLINRCAKLSGLDGQEMFPVLQKIVIRRSAKMKTPFEAPKASELCMEGSKEQMSLWYAKLSYSLNKLDMRNRTEKTMPDEYVIEDFTEMVIEHKENIEYPLSVLSLHFFTYSDALKLHEQFLWIEKLCLHSCDFLYWPEQFQSLVALKYLFVCNCKYLIRCVPSATNQLLPRLKTLHISHCARLKQIFNVAESVSHISIRCCRALESVGRQEFFPVCLKELSIALCPGLTEVIDLPLSLEELNVVRCKLLKSIEFVSGVLSIEVLKVSFCNSLLSLPNGLQTSQSLQYVHIISCPGIKKIPNSLKEQEQLGKLKLKHDLSTAPVNLTTCLPHTADIDKMIALDLGLAAAMMDDVLISHGGD